MQWFTKDGISEYVTINNISIRISNWFNNLIGLEFYKANNYNQTINEIIVFFDFTKVIENWNMKFNQG